VKSNLLFVLDKTALIHACFNGGDCVVKERVDSSEEVYYQCECDPTKSVYWVIHMLASFGNMRPPSFVVTRIRMELRFVSMMGGVKTRQERLIKRKCVCCDVLDLRSNILGSIFLSFFFLSLSIVTGYCCCG
jgi:hypothetical protein